MIIIVITLQCFTLEELEIIKTEEHASIPTFDPLTTTSCHSNCIREKGRNFCPCEIKASIVLVFVTMEILCA